MNAPTPDAGPRARTVFAGFFVGILLVQAAWIAAMPAFRGPDEFDHVFRAEGVAHGAIRPGGNIDSAMARGTMTPVRRSVIDAASDVCASYKYVNYYDCHAYQDLGHGWASVGSGAGRYNPAYYAVVGNLARPFSGVTVNYVIRAATAVICALMLAWAAAIWARLGRSRWRTLAFLCALTPVLLFSTTIAAPNGVSYAAALLLWVGGLAVLAEPTRRLGSPAAAVAVGGVVMCNTHTTGPIWLLLIALTWILLKPAAVLQILRDRRYWGILAAVGVASVLSVAWTLSSGANLPDESGAITSSPELGPLVANELAWLLQTIAAFPLRNEFAPPAVYILWLVGLGMLMVRSVRERGRTLLVVTWMVVAMITVQTILTYVGFKTDGYAWQGRYGLPFTVGLALVPVFFERRPGKPYLPLYHCALGGMAIAAGLSVWNVAHHERLFFQRPWTDHVAGGPIAAGLLAALGTALMARTLARAARPDQDAAARSERAQADVIEASA